NHPLSREILKWLGNVDMINISGYQEIVGRGQSGKYQDFSIRIGSASYVNTDKVDLDGSAVYVKINETLKGYFTLEQSWRSGLNELINALKAKHYDLHLISGDNERR